jgi:uncharacterized protein (TIGR03083 family)
MTATCHQRSHLAYCDEIGAVVRHLAGVVDDLDPHARVPTCPDWSVAELAEHTGGVHRWATGMVTVLSPKRISASTLNLGVPKDPRELGRWLVEGAEPLVDTLRAADPDAPMWAWGSDKHARFWSRRMVHETTVHAADAGFAAGAEPTVDPSVAVDGIDEFLDNLPHALSFAPRVAELRGGGETIAFAETSTGAGWTITLRSDDFVWEHRKGGADVTIEGAAADLLLLIYGRRKPGDDGRFRVTGDRERLDFWLERSSI